MTNLTHILPVIAVLSFSLLHQPAEGHSDLDDVYYSAAMCKPHIATTSNAQSDLRFQYSDANSDFGYLKGGWYNYDKSNKEILICPIPHNRFISGSVKAKVVVNDRSNGSDGNVVVQLCAQSAHGRTKCPSGSANDGSGGSFIGTKTVDVETPNTGSSDYRWYWLKLTLPSVDSQTGPSGILGYRVYR